MARLWRWIPLAAADKLRFLQMVEDAKAADLIEIPDELVLLAAMVRVGNGDQGCEPCPGSEVLRILTAGEITLLYVEVQRPDPQECLLFICATFFETQGSADAQVKLAERRWDEPPRPGR